MLVPDVNVLVYAHRPDSPRHEDARAWLARSLSSGEPVGVSELVLSGFLRVVTNHRVFADPSPPEVALTFCTALMQRGTVVPLRPGARHWPIFTGLCAAVGARGNAVPDAYHAALALENSATWVTTDRDFAKFPDLRWIPLPATGQEA
ncbi:type II toxin-antitoxin system VapC family toxin [Kineosporia sp. A_224]|jgi:hypothetical protein|uniref:type II toxin-antitoxin system VapC family toxin n=1 Tax=Kineosporia sp. A_224 TaxID=1962180 RepID=UPI000B4ACD99|nr:type II toxin-antitoxin system VapC family toxin [Kineosporia sp. A_224]